MKTYKNEDGKWCFDLTCNGRRVRQIVGLSRPETEQAMLNKLADLKRDKFGIQKSRENVFFEEFADEFLELAKQNKKSWTRDEVSLNNLKPFFKGKVLAAIGPELVEKYRAKRRAAGLSPATVNRELSLLKTLFNRAVEWGKLEVNPILKVRKFREPDGRERILTPEEMRRLIAAAADHLKPVLTIALNTGMRRNEILSLKWASVNFAQRFIFIGDSKSGKSRKVPMNGLVVEAFKQLPRNSEYVFFNAETGSPIKDVKTAFKSACTKAKINGLRLHDLRHTAASRMVEAGTDLVTVSKILGHSSIQMTMRYAHPTPENMQRAVDSLEKCFDLGENPVNKPLTVEVKLPATPSNLYN